MYCISGKLPDAPENFHLVDSQSRFITVGWDPYAKDDDTAQFNVYYKKSWESNYVVTRVREVVKGYFLGLNILSKE